MEKILYSKGVLEIVLRGDAWALPFLIEYDRKWNSVTFAIFCFHFDLNF